MGASTNIFGPQGREQSWNSLEGYEDKGALATPPRGYMAKGACNASPPVTGVVFPQRLSTSSKRRRRKTLETVHVFQHLPTKLRELKASLFPVVSLRDVGRRAQFPTSFRASAWKTLEDVGEKRRPLQAATRCSYGPSPVAPGTYPFSVLR